MVKKAKTDIEKQCIIECQQKRFERKRIAADIIKSLINDFGITKTETIIFEANKMIKAIAELYCFDFEIK